MGSVRYISKEGGLAGDVSLDERIFIAWTMLLGWIDVGQRGKTLTTVYGHWPEWVMVAVANGWDTM